MNRFLSNNKVKGRTSLSRFVLVFFLFLLPVHLFTPPLLATEPALGSETSPSPSPLIEELEHSLDEALNALANAMLTLVNLAERSKEKWRKCQSGGSQDEWCLKMKEAFKRLERLSKKKNGERPYR